MPKMKTHRGAAKRFRTTGSGKVKFKRAHLRHCLSSKSKDTKRELGQAGYMVEADAQRVRRLLHGD